MRIKLKPIPANVPFCHKNYRIALGLVAHIQKGVYLPPYKMDEDLFDIILEMFQSFEQTVNQVIGPWELVEMFFMDFLEKAKQGGVYADDESKEGFAIASLSLESDGNSEPQDVEALLNLTEIVDRVPRELAREIITSGIKVELMEKFTEVVDEALKASFSSVDERHIVEGDDFSGMDAMVADLKDLGRVNENYLLAMEELEALAMLRAINEELTVIKPGIPANKVLHILVDDSGSMSRSYKTEAVLYSLLRAYDLKRVHRLKEVIVTPFEGNIFADRRTEIDEPNKLSFRLGITNIENSIRRLVKLIPVTEHKNTTILVITDGDDKVNFFTAPVKINAMTLFQENKGLKRVCEKSGGRYFELKSGEDED